MRVSGAAAKYNNVEQLSSPNSAYRKKGTFIRNVFFHFFSRNLSRIFFLKYLSEFLSTFSKFVSLFFSQFVFKKKKLFIKVNTPAPSQTPSKHHSSLLALVNTCSSPRFPLLSPIISAVSAAWTVVDPVWQDVPHRPTEHVKANVEAV